MKWIMVLMMTVSTVYAQKAPKEVFYLFDKDWQSTTNMASTAYFMNVIAMNDTTNICRYYPVSGSMLREETFRDKELTIAHGRFVWYDAEGRIDSIGVVVDRQKNGQWTYYNDTLGVDKVMTYERGRLIEEKDYVTRVIRSAKGEEPFPVAKDKVGYSDEKEAVFPGGPKGYKKYLEKNLNPPENLYKNGVVKVQLVIDPKGKVTNLLLIKSLEYVADKEALRVLGSLPAWEPAFQNGKNVHYQALQYINFNVSE